jgi:hypothetical protein
MRATKVFLGLVLLAGHFTWANQAFALDQIIRPYQTVREDGMGGVKLTTGIYDENFFGNPARAADDPTWRISLFDVQLETNSGFISNVNSFTSSSSNNTFGKIADTAGTNNHGRFETAFPAYYLGRTNEHRKWTVALGLFSSVQADVEARNNYSIDPTVFVDVGPALTFAYRFLDDALAVGITGHAAYRVATNQTITIDNLLNGGYAPKDIAGHGGLVDADL